MLFEARQVAGDCILDVGHRLIARMPLRNAPRKGGAFGDEFAVFVLLDENSIEHDLMIALVDVGVKSNLTAPSASPAYPLAAALGSVVG